MKFSKKHLFYGIGIVLCVSILVSSSFLNYITLINRNIDITEKSHEFDLPRRTYISVNPIIIDNSSGSPNNWTWAVSQPWCTGSGTISDPYVIKNISIDANGVGHCLEIRNSLDVNFTIMECLFEKSGTSKAGIYLYGVTNGTIFNNTFSSNWHGMYLANSRFNHITQNSFNKNKFGIKLVQAGLGTRHNDIWHNFFIYTYLLSLQDWVGGNDNNYHNGTFGNYWSEFKSTYLNSINFTLSKLVVYQSENNYTITKSPKVVDLYPIMVNDTDNDGLDDILEVVFWKTNVTNNDTDGDRASDGWEANNGFNPLNSADGGKDSDQDGLQNWYECQKKWYHPDEPDPEESGAIPHKTDPHDNDTDNDGFSDGDEVEAGTRPTDPFSHPDRERAQPLISFGFSFLFFTGIGIVPLIYYLKKKQRRYIK